ncbi:hypothetical protein BGX38DRAFT_1181784, partial [Terfezia claveryi]
MPLDTSIDLVAHTYTYGIYILYIHNIYTDRQNIHTYIHLYFQHPLIDSISHHSSPLSYLSTASPLPHRSLSEASPNSPGGNHCLYYRVLRQSLVGVLDVWAPLSGAHRSAELVARLNLPRRTFIVLVNATSQGVWLRGRDSMCSTFVCLIKKGIGLGECSY